MKQAAPALALLIALLLPARPAAVARPAAPRHALTVTLDPKARSLAVTDVVTLPPGMEARSVEFLLFAGLKVTRSEPRAEEIPLGDVGPFFGNNAAVDRPSETLPLKRYRVFLGAGPSTVTLSYEGRLDTGLFDPKAEYARGFRETAGTISPEGVYLAGSSFWVPTLDPGLSSGLASFAMEARGPAGWHLVSQGSGTSGPGDGVARWDSGGPMDEIYLVGGPLGVTRDRAGKVETAVYLKKPDETLAGKYLAAAAQYLAMYESLIGPYPYAKFALVENFWETGYGMPSFALLGPEVIRFPFILHSSYPHEILHNWWGNSVLVDYASGNWCEGLTAYLADHLVEEQRGKGDEYRRAALLRYRSYVKEGRDFPLTGFRSRHSAATEAVGYGKALMTFHMIRRKVGDDAFRKALQGIARDFRGTRATFQDLRAEFEYASGADLSRLLSDFVFRAGAPELSVSIASVAKVEGGGWEVAFDLRQTQAGEAFAVDVPVVLQTEKGAISKTMSLTKAREGFAIVSPARPVALRVDPRFDVFRLLDARETPATLGQIFGDPKVLAVLSSKDEPALQDSYRKLLSGWQSDSQTIEVKLDTEVGDAGALPKDRAVWLVGRANRLAAAQFASRLKGEELVADGERMSLPGNSAVLVGRHPGNPEKAIGWLFTGIASALPGLSRKLPHYGKYATLGFEGSEPTNVLKSEGSAGSSPLVVDLRPEAERSARLPQLALEPRRALAELPPAFSQSRLSESVAWLAAAERKGRGLGSPGLEEATRWVADRFREAGLKPGGDGGTFVQGFRVEKGEDGRPHEVGNVIGILPGSKAEWKDESVLVTAHHDHLGLGFPDVHKGDEGKVHAGADDNASGVAVLIELARSLAAGEKPKRSIVFVSFTGEEAGRLGSKRYASSPGAFPVDRVIGVVNLDTVGRLGMGKVLVLGTGTATEWPHVFRGASWVTGVESSLVPGQHEASDQLTFIEKGIPGVQLFTGPHPDYHRPGDTADKIDPAGMTKVAALAREAVEFLAGRDGGLTKTIAASGTGGPSPSAPPAAPGGGRRVTFGTVPDFGFAGPGVRLEGTTPGSPAEKAGLRKGDVLVKVAGKPVESLRGFSEILRDLSPGQTVDVAYQRAGVERTASVTVVER